MKRAQASSSLPRRRVRRRHYDQAFKRHLVELTLVPGASVARIALDHRINANILFRWRRGYLRELNGTRSNTPVDLLPVLVNDTAQSIELISEGAPSVTAHSTRKQQRGAAGVIEIEFAVAQVRISGSVALDALRLVLQTLSDK